MHVSATEHFKACRSAIQSVDRTETDDPSAVFRDQLLSQLEAVPASDFEAVSNRLIQAGSTLEYSKYADALFEILFVGRLLQPGGTFLEDGAPPSPFAVVNAKEPTEITDIRPYVDVLHKVLRRYKYLQKPLEEIALPNLFQYTNRWPSGHKEKFAFATGLLMAQGLITANALQALTKDHLIKNDVSLSVLTLVFRAYLSEQTAEQLTSSLKKGGIKDIATFFPTNKRDPQSVAGILKSEGLPQISEWYIKRQQATLKESLISTLKEMKAQEESVDDIAANIKQMQTETPLPNIELVQALWQGFVSSVDWNAARPDQIEGLAVKELTIFAPILQPYCTTGKPQVALINAVQVHCYEDTRIIKVFPQLLKVLYNTDCVSEEAIIYWAQKGAKPQGKQHFLKATEPLVKYLQEDDGSDEE